ncbi:MAG: NUDIX hydrolase [Bacteroidales bacterium]
MSYTYKYPRPMVTVDALVFADKGNKRQVLLINRKNPPFKNKWALPGGFVEMHESLEDAVVRELEEETGLKISGFRQLQAFGKPNRDPRGRTISVVFIKLLEKPRPLNAGDDAAKAEWFRLSNLPALAFDHEEIIEEGLKSVSND